MVGVSSGGFEAMVEMSGNEMEVKIEMKKVSPAERRRAIYTYSHTDPVEFINQLSASLILAKEPVRTSIYISQRS